MAQLVINNTQEFDQQVWQTETEFDESKYQEAIKTMAEKLSQLYDDIESDINEGSCDVVCNSDLYPLGDVINLLNHLTVKVAEPRTQTFVLVHEWRDSDYNEDNEVICTSASKERIYEALKQHKEQLIKSFHHEHDDDIDACTIKTCDNNTSFSIYLNEWEIYDTLTVHLADEI